MPSAERDSYSKSEVEVIDSACKVGKISRSEFWREVEQYAFFSCARALRKLEYRGEERARESASLPDEKAINIILQRVISQEFYKALRELQRLQAIRLGLVPSVPLAVDIEVRRALNEDQDKA